MPTYDNVIPLSNDIQDAPTIAHILPINFPRRILFERISGILTMAISISFSLIYINIINIYTQNDYFWSHFNSTGAQSYMSDVYNAQLWNRNHNEFLLFSNQTAIEKDYSQSHTSITIQHTKARRIVLEYLMHLPSAIISLRSQSASTSMRFHLSYCWLDLTKHWEVAHTAKRQERCKLKYTRNGAAYMETMLRNMDWNAWYAIWGRQFEHSYGDEIRKYPNGLKWIDETTKALDRYTIEEELIYWEMNEIIEYRQAYQNQRIGGYDDSLMVETALNKFSMPLDHIVFSSRGPLWTTAYGSVGLWNDFLYPDDVNSSLIRNASNSFTLLPDSVSPEMWCGDYPDTPWSILLHDEIGPLSSIDLFLVSPPISLLNLYSKLYNQLLDTLQFNPILSELYNTLPSTTFDMIPRRWRIGYDYYGGNFFCYQAYRHDYVQQSFGFDDACAEPHPALTVDGSRMNILMAMWLQDVHFTNFNQRIDDICSYNNKFQLPCRPSLETMIKVYDIWSKINHFIQPNNTEINIVLNEIKEINIGIIQYATYNNTPLLLYQSLIDSNDFSWSFYGLLHLLDWAQGYREVISFDGDIQNVVVMSKQYPPRDFVLDSEQTPSRFSYTLRLLMWYTYSIVGFVILLSLFCGLLSSKGFSGRNFLFFNRVIGLVWIGRPLLIIRGMLAMVILSTGSIKLIKNNSFTQFNINQRSFLDIFILSGETLWMTYSIHDIVSITTQSNSWHGAILSSSFVWFLIGGIEYISPFRPHATFERNCYCINMDYQLTCTSGIVSIGSYERFCLLFSIQILFGIFYLIITRHHRIKIKKVPVIIPSIASYMLTSEGTTNQFYDPISSVFCGLISCHLISSTHVFSILLWVFVPLKDLSQPDTFRTPTMRLTPAIQSLHGPQTRPSIHDLNNSRHLSSLRFKQSFMSKVGLLFLVASAISSSSFIYISSAKLTNDFLWEGFNSTGMQAFLMDWYNNELYFRPNKKELILQDIETIGFYNSSKISISASLLYASIMQFEELSLLSIINGLRRTKPNHIIWIKTQFCYLDFKKRWEVASTLIRQERCHRMLENGAIYIEAILRNINLKKLKKYIGNSFDYAYFNELKKTNEGIEWVNKIEMNNMVTPNEELIEWQSYGIQHYTVQWQNYKQLGVIESLFVENAMGVQYPLTLKSSNGTYQFHLETSLKMYWGYGNDLWAISHNTTKIVYKSLIRNSSNFAFLNHSIENILAENQTITFPLEPSLMLVRETLGPFGSVDMYHIPCPSSLIELYLSYIKQDIITLHENIDAQIPVTLTAQSMHPSPSNWLANYSKAVGGNFLCPALAGGLELSYGQFTYCSVLSACGSNVWEFFYVQRQRTMMAMIAWGVFESCTSFKTCITIDEICKNITKPAMMCISSLKTIEKWTKKFITSNKLHEMYLNGEKVLNEIQLMNIETTQFLKKNSTSQVHFMHMNLFEPRDPYFEIISWHLLWEWVLGMREVISFHGDHNKKLNVISSLSFYYKAIPNPLQIPSNLVYYCRLCIQYTTSVVFIVTFITFIYAILCRGHIEGVNMLEINRVGGIVWVGRPLLSLRSLVAICFLSTSSITLDVNGTFTTIEIPETTFLQSLSTALAGSETCWLVIVLSDLCMAITKDYTNSYSLHSSVLVALGTIVLSFINPVQPSLHLERNCEIDEMDYQLVCTSGLIKIGNSNRLVQLVVMTIVVLTACFVVEKWRHRSFQLPQHHMSLMLPAGAVYLYHKGPWIYDGVLYLDKASAFMCGLITFTYNRNIYLLDVKTWRAHEILVDETFNPRRFSMDTYAQKNIEFAVPLVD